MLSTPPGKSDDGNKDSLETSNSSVSLQASASDLLSRLRGVTPCGDGWVAFCPSHPDGIKHGRRSLSLSIKAGRLLPHCFNGCTYIEILAALGFGKRSRHSFRRTKALGDTERAKLNREIAERIWRQQTRFASGTPVEDYLRSRGITIPIPPSIRFHGALKHPSGPFVRHAMVAGVQDVNGRFAAIHRTWLDGAQKTALQPEKAALGSIAGCAVRLSTQLENKLALTEGIETGLSILQATTIPTWVSLGTGNFVELPECVREIVICADRDSNGAGEKAARAAAAKYTGEGRKVRIARPPMEGDFNDLLQA
jgi:putative DNA primase/helicase